MTLCHFHFHVNVIVQQKRFDTQLEACCKLYATLVECAWVFPLWSLVVSYHKAAIKTLESGMEW